MIMRPSTLDKRLVCPVRQVQAPVPPPGQAERLPEQDQLPGGAEALLAPHQQSHQHRRQAQQADKGDS